MTIFILFRLSWGLQNLANTAALFISIVYWAILHPLITYPSTTGLLFSIFLHMFNSITCAMDIFINARPVQISHFYFSSFFGLYYALFSIIYWVLGGKGGLGCDIAKLGNEGPCEDFIYPILDWEDKPLDAFALVGAGVVIGMPVLQTVWWSLYKLRISIRKSCCKSESRGDKMTLVDRA